MKHVLLALFTLVALTLPARAQDGAHAKATLFARVQGNDVQVALEIEIDRNWHAYHGPTNADLGHGAEDLGKPTRVELIGDGITWGDWRYPTPSTIKVDFGTPVVMNVHVGKVVLYRRGTLSAGAKIDGLQAKIDGQTCEDGEGGTCVPYKETIGLQGAGSDAVFAAFPKDLTVTAAAKSTSTPSAATPAKSDAGTKPATAAAPARSTSEEEEPGRELSLAAFLWAAVFWGFVTLLMPCTYPMIPITISFFTKQASAHNTNTLPLSIAYGVGIVAIFVVIGLLVGPLVIAFATHPVTNIVIGVMFLVFALSLFGAMNLQPPRFLLDAAGSASHKGGYLGVFLMGATLVITSFTCTAPFVGSLLSAGATQGSLGRIALGMGVFGATIAVPFVGLSMVPARVKQLPKSGEWMHTLKVWLGFIEVAAALKFISNADLVAGWHLLSRELFLTLWAAILFAAAAYLFAWIRISGEFGDGQQVATGPKRMAGGLATLLFAFYCAYGALGNRMDPLASAIIPPYSSHLYVQGTAAGEKGHVTIEDDFEAALERAKKDKKLLLANFTGFSCTNCRLMEENVFPAPEVASILREHYIEARLHNDGGSTMEHILELQEKYTHTRATPIYVVIDPATGQVLRKRAGYVSPKEFAKFLE